MHMIKYVIKEKLDDGIWTSPEVFEAKTLREVNQAVLAGYRMNMGSARWAENELGTFICGIDAKGKPLDYELKDGQAVVALDGVHGTL